MTVDPQVVVIAVVALVLGGLYGGAQLLKTIGLEHTSASVSGFLTGAYVVLTPLLAAGLLRERIPRARLEVVAGTGHLFFIERPEQTLRLLGDFLA